MSAVPVCMCYDTCVYIEYSLASKPSRTPLHLSQETKDSLQSVDGVQGDTRPGENLNQMGWRGNRFKHGWTQPLSQAYPQHNLGTTVDSASVPGIPTTILLTVGPRWTQPLSQAYTHHHLAHSGLSLCPRLIPTTILLTVGLTWTMDILLTVGPTWTRPLSQAYPHHRLAHSATNMDSASVPGLYIPTTILLTVGPRWTQPLSQAYTRHHLAHSGTTVDSASVPGLYPPPSCSQWDHGGLSLCPRLIPATILLTVGPRWTQPLSQAYTRQHLAHSGTTVDSASVPGLYPPPSCSQWDHGGLSLCPRLIPATILLTVWTHCYQLQPFMSGFLAIRTL